MYWAEAGKTIIDKIVEEGLWIVLMYDMWAMGGRIYEYQYDSKGNKHENFLWSQRYHIVKTLKWLTDDKFSIGVMANIPNPFSYVFRFMKPFVNILEKTHIETTTIEVEVPETEKSFIEKTAGKAGFVPPKTTRTVVVTRKYYIELDPLPRIMLAFMFPAVLRVVLRKVEGTSFFG